VAKVGQLSQNVRLDFSRPEDKFVLLIENFDWDPDKVTESMLLSDIKTSSADMATVRQTDRSCLQFYNKVLENLGPLLRIQDGLESTGFSMHVLDTISRGLSTSGSLDKEACLAGLRFDTCLSGQKIRLLERLLQNGFHFNKTVYIEGDTFGKFWFMAPRTIEHFIIHICMRTIL
jgi:hypothetical protein